MMALRGASATARPPPLAPPPCTTQFSSPTKAFFPCKTTQKPPLVTPSNSVTLPTSTTLSLLFLFAAPHEAKAFSISKEQIVSSLTQVEETIEQVQKVSSDLLDGARLLIDSVARALKPGIDAVSPIVQQAGEQAVNIASPAISEASKKAQEAIQSTGINTEPVVTAAKTVAGAAQQTTKVIEVAKPIASSTIESIVSAEPITIVVAGGTLFLAYLLLPPVFSAISFSFRGYQGDLSPAQALDLVSTKNYIMVDIRSEKDKDKAGIPRLPSSAKNKLITIPLEDLPSKLRGLVRNVKKVEAELVALKISHLKKINKGSNIVILDSYSDTAKIVARTLTSLGFKNTWVVADGFSGRKGWLQNRLGTDSYNLSVAEVVSPSRIIPSAVRRFGRTSSAKLLPGGSD